MSFVNIHAPTLRAAIVALAAVLVVVAAVSIGGCEYVTPGAALNQQVAGKPIEHSIITWKDEQPRECGPLVNGVSGCASVISLNDGKTTVCTITLPKNSQDWLVAHELKHCFGWEDNR